MQIFVMRGSDGGGFYIGSDGKIHPVPGWEAGRMAEVQIAINLLREASRLKTPGLATSLSEGLGRFVHNELSGHLDTSQTGVAVIA